MAQYRGRYGRLVEVQFCAYVVLYMHEEDEEEEEEEEVEEVEEVEEEVCSGGPRYSSHQLQMTRF